MPLKSGSTGPISPRHRALAVAAAAGFLGFLVWIVITANRGGGTPWWSFIDQVPFGDKLGHLGLAGSLSFLCNLAFPSGTLRFAAGLATRTSLILLGLVSAEELSQAFIATRQLDLYDWLADLAGLWVGQTAARRITPRAGESGPAAVKAP